MASGKGGVGKTTTAVNVALALTSIDVRVGLVDADLYGPDAAHMIGLRRSADASHITLFAAPGTAAARIEAVTRHGVQIASTAFLIGENQGVGLQGPLARLLVHRLISGTNWEDIDCVIVDLPPGAGDIQQSVFGLADRTIYTIVVVTPQVVAHRDAHRLLQELERANVAILGGIENMAYQICQSCGDITTLFTAAPEDEAIWTRIPKLASIPFSAPAARDADRGKPVMITRAVAQQVAAYEQVACQLRALIGRAAGGESLRSRSG
jgi:ATP-binding protein involved in chromosome partitioning